MPQSLEDALRLTPGEHGLSADLTGDFSNGPQSQPPEKGFPFGGLLAALAAGAMREGLGLTAPLRTLTVQYLAAARFGRQVELRPRLVRGGRTVAYAAVEAGQGERHTLHAMATYGGDAETVQLRPLTATPPAFDSLDPSKQIRGPMAPWFTQYVDYRFETGPNILGGNEGKDAVERLADIAAQVNERQENIGARRLHTVLERLLDTLSYEAPDRDGDTVTIDRAYVDDHLGELVQDPDLSRYIL